VLTSPRMITVGCAGFAVPATRYFKEFSFVEIQETHLAVPGRGTMRRWQREAPKVFEFALLGPREIGQEGFRRGTVIEAALDSLVAIAEELGATTAVFLAPPEFSASKPNRAALEDFLTMVGPRFRRVVFDAGEGWDPSDSDALAEKTATLAARDPLAHGLSKRQEAYYRMPGPAGRKSRYEDPAIERLGEIASKGLEQDARYVFANVDMFADAKRFRKTLPG
jgi:uncharacterized protein YecE (DUF72 family)